MAVQITAGVIFIVMFIFIVSEAVERHRASLLCGLVMLVLVQGIMMRDVDAVWRILSLDSFVNPYRHERFRRGTSSSGDSPLRALRFLDNCREIGRASCRERV